jgi:hypothetical protein
MRETVEGLRPRICARPDCVISSNADARRTAPVITRRGSGLVVGETRGIEYLWKYFSSFHSIEMRLIRQPL